MRRNTYIGITVIIIIFGIIILPKIFKRVANDDVVRGGRMNVVGGMQQSDTEEGLAYITLNGKDRKAPAFTFVNQDNDTITNADYKGKVYLVEFFFSRCINICIPMSYNLQEIATTFKDEDNFGIASFSIDPNHDTPEVLKAYAADYNVTHPNWNFLTGDFEMVYELSNVGFNIPVGQNDSEDNLGLYHSGLFALVDQNGFLRSRRDDYGNPIIYYRGFIPNDAEIIEGGETSQVNELIEDIKTLLE